MIGWFRRVWRGFSGYVELIGRMDELEEEIRRHRRRVDELELEWTNDLEQVRRMYQRQSKRIADGVVAITDAAPSVTDNRAARAVRKRDLRTRILRGNDAPSVSGS